MLRTKLVAPAIEWQRKLRVTETEKTFRVDSTRVIKKSAIQSTLFRAIGFVKNPEATIAGGHGCGIKDSATRPVLRGCPSAYADGSEKTEQ